MFYLRVHTGEHIPRMDFSSNSSDPFVVVKFNGDILRTGHVKRDINPTWNEKILMPVFTPCMTDSIDISLWDHCRLNPDEYIGGFKLKFSDLISEALPPVWVNIYGVPVDEDGFWGWMGDVFRPIIATGEFEPTAYLGRILMSAKVETAFALQRETTNAATVPEPDFSVYELR